MNNVCYNGKRKPSLKNFLILRDYLTNILKILSENLYAICDPRLGSKIDDKNSLRELIENGDIHEAPKVADEFILSYAASLNCCFIISNDKYRQYKYQIPCYHWLQDKIICFMIIRNQICLSPNINYKRLYANPSKKLMKIGNNKQKNTTESD